MKTAKAPRRRFGLAGVICIAILVTCLIVSAIVTVENYYKYLDAVYEIYSDEAYRTARMIDHCVGTEEWKRYAETAEAVRRGELPADSLSKNAGYISLQTRLRSVVDSMDLSSLTVFTVDTDSMNSFTDQDYEREKSNILTTVVDLYPTSSEKVAYDGGDPMAWWETYDEFDIYRVMLNTLITDGKAATAHETADNSNMIVTEYYPIIDGDDFVALIMISYDAKKIEGFMQSFFIQTFLLAGAAAVVLSLGAMAFFWLRIVRPLRIVTHEADRFIGDNAAVSQRLPAIRTRDEIQTLSESFLHMENDIRGYVERVSKAAADRERISTELNIATRIQEGMLPNVFPAFPDRGDFSVYAVMKPAKEVGGDFYDFFLIDHDRLALVIADASGKGVPASLFMVVTKTLIKNRAMMGGTPAQILADVNKQLCDGNDTGMFVTVWFAILDLKTGRGLAVNAGHEHPVYRKAGGSYEMIKYRHCVATAVTESAVFSEREFTMRPGDRIFVYTDGLPEAGGVTKELYGSERILRTLNEHPDAGLPEVLDIMSEDAERFTGAAEQFDDLTMLIFEYYGPDREGA